MQSSNHSGVVSSNAQGASIAGLNGRIAFPGSNGSGQQHTRGEPNFIFENVDPTNLDGDDDSDDELSPSVQFRGAGQGSGQPGTPSALKPGKKTKGRVKIKMEFIENKLRRYTTFSKRKTGIMKKAYELSTLTGTQVMLLVASETGHVYTFATRKLQPMITSDSGKALIQTCLNSPDPPPGTSGHTTLEQRMNPTGYEETELSYSVSDEDGKIVMDSMGDKPFIHMAPSPAPAAITVPSAVRPSSQPATTISHPITTFTSQPIALAAQTSGASDSNKVTSIPIQFPGLILQTSGGQQVAIPASQLGVATSTQPQAIYRPATGTVITAASHTTSAESSTVCTPSFSFLSGGTTPSQIIMYQTPQGVVYAAPTPTTLGTERTIFNFQQPATAISIPHSDSGQIFTIPVSLANAQSILRLSAAPTGETVKAEAHAAPAKKARK